MCGAVLVEVNTLLSVVHSRPEGQLIETNNTFCFSLLLKATKDLPENNPRNITGGFLATKITCDNVNVKVMKEPLGCCYLLFFVCT